MNKILMAAMAAASVMPLWAVQGTIVSDTVTRKGDIKWYPSSKVYGVTYKGPSGGTMNYEVKLDNLKSIDIPKPANFDRLAALVRDGNGAAAIGALKKIVAEYRMLTWDKPAGRYLVEAYIQAEKVQDAYSACQAVFTDDKTAAYTGELAPAYWKCLLKLGKHTQLEEVLKKAATKGTRCDSASALVMRGDIALAKGGDNAEAYRQALVDGYLRVAFLYRDAECKIPCAEALTKAAHCFDKLGQANRAEAMRTTLQQIQQS